MSKKRVYFSPYSIERAGVYPVTGAGVPGFNSGAGARAPGRSLHLGVRHLALLGFFRVIRGAPAGAGAGTIVAGAGRGRSSIPGVYKKFVGSWPFQGKREKVELRSALS